MFLYVTPGERDLPRPVFGSKDQCGAGADHHARLRQGKGQCGSSSAEKFPEMIALSTFSQNTHVHSHKQTQTHAVARTSARTNAWSLLFQWTEQKRN